MSQVRALWAGQHRLTDSLKSKHTRSSVTILIGLLSMTNYKGKLLLSLVFHCKLTFKNHIFHRAL